jgi:NAD(P)-dependent dehydrogenase (short-subunit alcohol dehydrogenase family)
MKKTWEINKINDQTGRTAIITGANSGLGLEVSRALASKGFKVILACRNIEKGNHAKADIISTTNNQSIEVLPLDLASQKSVRDFADRIKQKFTCLDILINNAGVMFPPYSVTEDGFEYQLATNYLGHFTLTNLLFPLLENTLESRVVSVSSLAHTYGRIHFKDIHSENAYDPSKAYAQSKLACLMFAFELNKKLRANGAKVSSVAAHPGVAGTNLFEHTGKFIQFVLEAFICQSAQHGSLPLLYAALGEDIQGGDFCGPSGLLGFRGNPVKIKAKSHAYDHGVASQLWDLSEKATGVKYFAK